MKALLQSPITLIVLSISFIGIIDIAFRATKTKMLWIIVVLLMGPLGYGAYLLTKSSRS